VFFYSQAAIVSYVLLVLPFCAAYVVFKAMDALLSIQKLLMAINVYNACYCALPRGHQPVDRQRADGQSYRRATRRTI
jgi:hypothetical protein